MTEPTDNLALWNAVCQTDQAFTKKVTMRGGFTSINPTYQCRMATEQWGPQGAAWGIKDIRWEFHGESIIVSGTFWYPDGEFVQAVDDHWKDGDDTMKKCLTELQSKALSRLGFNADIFEGRWDDNRYVMDDQRDATPERQPRREPPPGPGTKEHRVGQTVPNAPSEKQVKRLWAIAGSNGWTNEQVHLLIGSKFNAEHCEQLSRDEYNWLCGDDKKKIKGALEYPPDRVLAKNVPGAGDDEPPASDPDDPTANWS